MTVLKALPASGHAAILPTATPSSRKLSPDGQSPFKEAKPGVAYPAAASPDFCTESEGGEGVRESVVKLMMILLVLATLAQGLFFILAAELAFFHTPDAASDALAWGLNMLYCGRTKKQILTLKTLFGMFAVYLAKAFIRALLAYLYLIALSSVYHSLLFWDTPAYPALTYPSWLVPMDARAAISFLVTNGFWLLVGTYILRCSEVLATACDDNYWSSTSANLYAWVSQSCVDTPSAHPATVFSMLVAQFVIQAVVVGVEIMVLMCLYGYSMAIASDEERELLMYHLAASSERTSPPAPVAETPSPPPLPTEEVERKRKRMAKPPPQSVPELQSAHAEAGYDKRRMEKQGKPKPGTFTRIKSAFQIIRGAPQPSWLPLPTYPVPRHPLPRPPSPRPSSNRVSSHMPSALKAPLVHIKSWFGSPCQKVGRVQNVAVELNKEGSGRFEGTRARAVGPTPSAERSFFKTPRVQLSAEFGAALTSAASGRRADMSKAAETKPKEVAVRTPSHLELERGPRPTTSVERAQFFKTPGLNLSAQLEVRQLPGPVGSQGKVEAVTKERQVSLRALPKIPDAKPQSRTSQKQEKALGAAQEADVKPYVQIRAMFEPLSRAEKPDGASARVPPSARRPPKSSASGPRAPWVRDFAAQVERQLQQHMQSPRPRFFNVSVGIRQIAASDAPPAGFNYLRLRAPRMAAGPRLQLPPLLVDRAGFGLVRPLRPAVGAEGTVRPQPFLPVHTEGTARRLAGEQGGQQRPEPRPDPRLKALQSVLIKASFTPQATEEARPEIPIASVERLPPETGKPQDVPGQPTTSSPPPPSMPPPPPPLPPPPPHVRRRSEPFFFKFDDAVAKIRARDIPTHAILGGITQYPTLPGAQRSQQAQKPPSFVRLPPAAAPAEDPQGPPSQPASSEDAPWAASPTEAPQQPGKVADGVPQATGLPSEPQQAKQPASSKDTPKAATAPEQPQQPQEPAIPDDPPQTSAPTKEPEQPQQPVSRKDVPQTKPKPASQ